MKTYNLKSAVDLPQAEQIILQTLAEIRGLPSATHDPLQAGLRLYMQGLRRLDASSHQLIKQQLQIAVVSEPDLGTRFLLRLISDATEAVIEQRTLPYLQNPDLDAEYN